MISILRRILYKLFSQTAKTLFDNSNEHNNNDPRYNFKSFGELNKDKIFYLIKRTPGAGLFSNLTFVLNHMFICKKIGFIPIVDMENYKTIYNEKKKIKNTFNSWEYYFNKLNEYSLDEVYKSKNVILTSNIFYHSFFFFTDKNKDLKNILQNEIKINKILYKTYKKIFSSFGNKKVLGIHFRGTSFKRSPGHTLPATKKQMLKITKKIIKEEKIEKIFLVTEELDYLNFFKQEFGEMLIFLKSAYRSNKNDAFKIYPRKFHRYKLGREILIETLLLSGCDIFLYCGSNVSNVAMSFNINKNQKRFEIDNGLNSKNILISQFLWYLKKNLPADFGGFKKITKM